MPRQLTRRLTHEAPTRVEDGAGGWTRSWEMRGAHWCEVRMRSGQLRPTEFGRTPRLAVRIVTHAVPQDQPTRPWPGHRLSDLGRGYIVDAVHENDPNDRYMTILASEEVVE
ncbi:head-tail adaptor protein [Jannaschia seohaensis]|uniref:Head-tail joining protein n=1 Tax=Jannaschia seohaensis TaxID=475081 RepID=A0A2Y9AR66_9RHOB|nr:head-tail adaptor protein [Jannaschia seohaensis]PWJ19149.1 head-tail joining protein [Jannaschia seohaensis]SSA45808.1 Phage head-tail joining protein [Jannaschia seohaensis]